MFDTPRRMWASPDADEFNTVTGTSDLQWCSDLVAGDYIRKAGWRDYWESVPDKQYPLLCDTRLFCYHIEKDGRQFPAAHELEYWRKNGAGKQE